MDSKYLLFDFTVRSTSWITHSTRASQWPCLESSCANCGGSSCHQTPSPSLPTHSTNVSMKTCYYSLFFNVVSVVNSQLWPGKRQRFICVYIGFLIRLLCNRITFLNASFFWLSDKLHKLSEVLNYTRAQFKEVVYAYFTWMLNNSGKVHHSRQYRARIVQFFPEFLVFMQFYCICRELGDTGSLLLPCAVLPSPGMWYFT